MKASGERLVNRSVIPIGPFSLSQQETVDAGDMIQQPRRRQSCSARDNKLTLFSSAAVLKLS